MSPSLQHRHLASPRRHLVLGQARRRIIQYNRASLQSDDEESAADKRQILSAYRVPLPADSYIVSVAQTAKTPAGDQLSPASSKRFDVVAPRFSLPADAVHSTYPPQGHQDTVEVLPHIVFNDFHLPWERAIKQPTDGEDGRNRVPWLALLTFTQDELRIPSVALQQAPSASSPTITQALRLEVATVASLSGVSTPLANLSDATGTASIIFVAPKLFNAYVTKFDEKGKPDPSQVQADVSRYKYLSHSRRLNTMGMAESAGQDVALKSVVVSHRLAPLDALQPVSMIVHLVSLEGIDSMPFPVGSSQTAVALVSLYSWVYTALPPSSLDTHDLFANIGRSVDLLRAPASIISAIPSSGPFLPPFAGIWLQRRLQDGYTLTRYRTKTGEVTVGMTRGALTPSQVPHPLSSDWTSVSHSGEGLQIVDPDVGFIDLSYSAAWNLGKSMALADQGFSASLCRIRSAIFAGAIDRTKKDRLRSQSALPSRLRVVKSLPRLAHALHRLVQHHHHHRPPHNNSQKWVHMHPKRVDLSFRAPSIQSQFAKHASAVARRLASSLEDPDVPYDEHNTPYSADWALVFRWLLDRMYLIDVPAHYLVTEPSHLPPESLRFFHVDPNWIDAFVDGALSICNHIGTDDIRSKIKAEFHRYLDTVNPAIGYRPQIPSYGFVLRSGLVSLFPDLQVNIAPPPADGRAPILRLERIAPGLLLCLVDRVPPDDFYSLTLTQPPHQLSFAAAASVTASSFTTEYKRVYTKHVDDPNRAKPLGTATWTRGDTTRDPVFLWTDDDSDSDGDGDDDSTALPLRMLLFPAWATDVFNTIHDGMRDPDHNGSNHPDWFEDSTASAALNAIQLANPAYRLDIALPNTQQGPDGTSSATVPLLPQTSIPLRASKKPTISKKQHFASPPSPSRQSTSIPSGEYRAPSPVLSRSSVHESSRFAPRAEQRFPSYRHAVKHMRPPHYPALSYCSPTTSKTAAANLTSRSGGDNTQGLPEISFSLSAAGRAVGQAIPSKTDTPLDLIFAVRVTPDTSTSYQLKEVRITVFLGPATSSSPRLMDAYEGPGATMLSNLRFYSLAQHDPDQENRAIHLRLLPRSRTRQIPVSKLLEMGFCLSMAEVNAFDADTTVQIRYQIIYDSNFDENWFSVVLNADTNL